MMLRALLLTAGLAAMGCGPIYEDPYYPGYDYGPTVVYSSSGDPMYLYGDAYWRYGNGSWLTYGPTGWYGAVPPVYLSTYYRNYGYYGPRYGYGYSGPRHYGHYGRGYYGNSHYGHGGYRQGHYGTRTYGDHRSHAPVRDHRWSSPSSGHHSGGVRPATPTWKPGFPAATRDHR